MATFKLTDNHRTLIREWRAAGFSLRAIAAKLEATEGVGVTPKAIKDALDRDVARAPQAERSSTPAPSNVATKQPESSEIGDSAEGDAADYARISRIIDELDGDIEKAREQGNVQGQTTLERLRLDALKRRRELRPPAPPAEVDAELLDAGRRAAEKLRSLLALALAEGA